MAKKPLTPEQAEIKAMKKAKKSENWTKFWAVLLAGVLTFAVVSMGKTAAEDAISKAAGSSETTDNNGDSSNNSGNTNSSDPFGDSTSSDPFGDSSNTSTGSNNQSSSGSQSTGNQSSSGSQSSGNQSAGNQSSGNQSTGNQSSGNQSSGNQSAGNQSTGNQNSGTTNNGPSTAEVIKVFNDTTAKAAKGSYKINRAGQFTKSIDVGDATEDLNDIITGVDPNATLDSVVGGFLGINKPVEATVTNGKGEGFDGKYMLKAMTLTESDVEAVKVDGDKYMIKIKKCVTPDANSPLAHATNDYITFAEVNKGISDAVGSLVKVEESGSEAIYDNIIFTATVADGKLTNLEYEYTFSATLAIKIIVAPATGTGEAKITGKYTNIQY